MRSIESVLVAQYFNIFLSKMALIKLNNQCIQIIAREVRVSESADCYLNVRVDSLLFFFFYIFPCSTFVFGIRVSDVLKRIRPLLEIKIVSSFTYSISIYSIFQIERQSIMFDVCYRRFIALINFFAFLGENSTVALKPRM